MASRERVFSMGGMATALGGYADLACIARQTGARVGDPNTRPAVISHGHAGPWPCHPTRLRHPTWNMDWSIVRNGGIAPSRSQSRLTRWHG